MKTNYVLGFLFSENGSQVALINKNRPDWQKGFWNGIGGHIEDKFNETPKEAFIREFKEETGVDLPEENVMPFGVMNFKNANVYLFKAFGNEFINSIETKTDETVSKFKLSELHTIPIIKNLTWLIPMALESIVEFGDIKHSI